MDVTDDETWPGLLCVLTPHAVVNRDLTQYISSKRWVQVVGWPSDQSIKTGPGSMFHRQVRRSLDIRPWQLRRRAEDDGLNAFAHPPLLTPSSTGETAFRALQVMCMRGVMELPLVDHHRPLAQLTQLRSALLNGTLSAADVVRTAPQSKRQREGEAEEEAVQQEREANEDTVQECSLSADPVVGAAVAWLQHGARDSIDIPMVTAATLRVQVSAGGHCTAALCDVLQSVCPMLASVGTLTLWGWRGDYQGSVAVTALAALPNVTRLVIKAPEEETNKIIRDLRLAVATGAVPPHRAAAITEVVGCTAAVLDPVGVYGFQSFSFGGDNPDVPPEVAAHDDLIRAESDDHRVLFPHLTKVDVSGAEGEARVWAALSRLQSLRSLDVTDEHGGVDGLLALSSIDASAADVGLAREERAAWEDSSPLAAAAVATIATVGPSLRTIRLRSCNTTLTSPSVLSSVWAHCTALQDLTLVMPGRVDAAVFAGISSLTSLRALTFEAEEDNTYLGEEHVLLQQGLEALPLSLTKLEVLSLTHLCIGVTDRFVAAVSHLPSLVEWKCAAFIADPDDEPIGIPEVPASSSAPIPVAAAPFPSLERAAVPLQKIVMKHLRTAPALRTIDVVSGGFEDLSTVGRFTSRNITMVTTFPFMGSRPLQAARWVGAAALHANLGSDRALEGPWDQSQCTLLAADFICRGVPIHRLEQCLLWLGDPRSPLTSLTLFAPCDLPIEMLGCVFGPNQFPALRRLTVDQAPVTWREATAMFVQRFDDVAVD